MKHSAVLAAAAIACVPALSGQPTAKVSKPEVRNVLMMEWSGRYGGVPPFDKVRVEDFKPALEQAISDSLAAVEAITSNHAEPTFENTLAQLERATQTLDRVQPIYSVWAGTMSSKEFRDVESEMAPKLAEFEDRVLQNGALFKRVEAVYQSKEMNRLTPEQQRLVWDRYTDFVRSGAKLSEGQKKQIAEINQRLASLYSKFRNNLLHDEESYVLFLTKDQLGGLPSSYVDAAAAAAKQRGQDGKYSVLNTRSSVEPFLVYSTERGLREKVWRTFYNRGDNADEFDNNGIITEILKLRGERTRLQGYKTFADRALEKQVAKTPQAAMDLMMRVWRAAVARVHEEVADMQAIAAGVKIAPWDYRFYAEKVRQARYDLDSNEVKKHLQLEKLREAMMWAAGRLYGFEFKQLADVPVYHPDVRVWEVTRAGKHVGLWYFDPYARPGKRSGAWMSTYRKQQRQIGKITTIVSNNSNFVKGSPGQPVLISWEDAETLFHEFGHAIHGLNSDVTYPSQAGTSVPRDYVEFPSQLNEHWLLTPEVLNRFALHYQTGKPMPAALVDKLKTAETFNQGFATAEFLASALVDMKLHSLADPSHVDPDAFERDTLKALAMPSEIVMRHRTPQFSHVFSSEGYAAMYYSYLWADSLTADAWEAFVEAGGPWDATVAARLRKEILSVGNTIDPAEAYRKFRGRDVDANALMRARGFAK